MSPLFPWIQYSSKGVILVRDGMLECFNFIQYVANFFLVACRRNVFYYLYFSTDHPGSKASLSHLRGESTPPAAPD